MARIFNRQRRSDYAPAADRKISKQIERFIKAGEYVRASQMYESHGMLREAVNVLEKHGLAFQGANLLIKHRYVARGVTLLLRNQHHFQAVQVCIRHRMYDKAGEIYASQGYYSQGAECYVKAHRNFLAAHCYEKARKYLLAGRYYGYSAKLEHSLACYVRYVKIHPKLEDVTNQDRHIVALCLQKNHSALEQLCCYLHRSSYIIPVINVLAQKGEMTLLAQTVLFARLGDLKAYIKKIDFTSEYAHVIARALFKTDKARISGYIFEKNGEYELAAESFVRVGEKSRAIALYYDAGRDDLARSLLEETQVSKVSGESMGFVDDQGKDFHTGVEMLLKSSDLEGEEKIESSEKDNVENVQDVQNKCRLSFASAPPSPSIHRSFHALQQEQGSRIHCMGSIGSLSSQEQPQVRGESSSEHQPPALMERFYQCHLLLKLSQHECDVIWEYGKVLTVSAGDIICEKGSHYDGCYMVLKGAVQDHFYKRKLSETSLCGERSLLCGSAGEEAHLSAITESVVFFLARERLEMAAVKHGLIVCKVLQSLAGGLISELEANNTDQMLSS